MAREAAHDQASSLPPLNMALAKELVQRTRISKLIKAGRPASRMQDLCRLLVNIDQMYENLVQLDSLDLNPIFLDDNNIRSVPR